MKSESSEMNDLVEFPYIDCQVRDIYMQKGVDLVNFEMVRFNAHNVSSSSIKNKDLLEITCECIPKQGEEITCGSECINRMLYIECYGDTRCGENCGNRSMQTGNNLKFVIYKCGDKGYGLKCLENIKKDQYVIEFVGEIIDKKQFNKRFIKYNNMKIKHNYIMVLKSNYYIDATLVGGASRFINHSCEPNLRTEKWSVSGYTRMGMFANTDISAGTELTFDYKFERFGEPVVCLCKSANCKGYLGKSSTKSYSIPKLNIKSEKSPKRENGSDKPKSFPNPATIVRYMNQQPDWIKRFKVIDYIVKTFPFKSMRELVDNNICDILARWMEDLDPAKFNADYFKKFVEIFKLLPIVKISDFPASRIKKILKQWMILCSSRKIIGEDKNILEFGGACRVLLDRVIEIISIYKNDYNPQNGTDESINRAKRKFSPQIKSPQQKEKAKTTPISISKNPDRYKHQLLKFITLSVTPYYHPNDEDFPLNTQLKFESVCKNLTKIVYNKLKINQSIDNVEFNNEERRKVIAYIEKYLQHLSQK